ncbi:MAG TPA: CHAD domain-containing protein [Thermoplasmata archaeon]|nr:CHAD domain-containing protein [Thermoplasmata archaeon]
MARRASPPASPPGPLRLQAELLTTLARLDHRLAVVLGRTGIEVEEIHEIHRDLRRLASGLTVWSRLVPAADAAASLEAARRTRRLSRLVGRVRDRDVTTALLAPVARRRVANGTGGAWTAFLVELREDTHIQRELLRAFLRTERQAGLFERSRALLQLRPRPDAGRGLARILAEERRRRQGRVRRAHRKALRKPSSRRLHRLRIRIRQWRHLLALEVAARATRHPPPPSWQRLQDRLGHLHDLDIALASLPKELAGSAPARRLREGRRRLRHSVQRSLERIVLSAPRAGPRAAAGGRR